MARLDTATLCQATEDVRDFGVVVLEADADALSGANADSCGRPARALDQLAGAAPASKPWRMLARGLLGHWSAAPANRWTLKNTSAAAN